MAQFFCFIHLSVLNHLIVLSSFWDYRSYHNEFELHLTLMFVLSLPLALALVFEWLLMAVSDLMAGHLDPYGAVDLCLRK